MKKGIVLVNLGTPKSSKREDVQEYLVEFLTDGRVIDMPWVSRQLLVRGAIIPKRIRESTRTYQEIWTEEGSPLLVYGKSVKMRLQEALGDSYVVSLGMRYQEPSLEEALKEVQNCASITLLPLFPQYASATTGSVFQEALRYISKWRSIPRLHFVNEFATHPSFIEAFAAKINGAEHDHVLLSFHGLPLKQLQGKACNFGACCQTMTRSNYMCYSAQCFATARAIADAANLKSYSVSFQSRLGKDPWMEPFTSDAVQMLAQAGNKQILVVCPSFVCDCLETLYEINIENRALFLEAGGKELTLCPSLNDDPLWIRALKDIATEKIPNSPQHSR